MFTIKLSNIYLAIAGHRITQIAFQNMLVPLRGSQKLGGRNWLSDCRTHHTAPKPAPWLTAAWVGGLQRTGGTPVPASTSSSVLM